MKNEKINKGLLTIAQPLCILGVFLWVDNYTLQHHEAWLLFYITPLFVTLFLSFALSVFLPMKIDLKTAALISTPAALMYIGLYILMPMIINFDAFHLVAICSVILPGILMGFLMTIFVVWIGPKIRAGILKKKSSKQ